MLRFVQARAMLRTVGISDNTEEENLSCKVTVERKQDHSKLCLIVVKNAELFVFRVTIFYATFLYPNEPSFGYCEPLVLSVHLLLGKLWVLPGRLR